MTKATGVGRGRRSRLWTEYPKMFLEAIDSFTLNPEQTEWKQQLSKQDAYTAKTQFYRFFECIRGDYDAADPDTRERTGLNSAFHWANNLVISVVRYGEWFYIRVRKTGFSDNESRLPTPVKERIAAISRNISEQEISRKDDMSNIVGDFMSVEPTTTIEEIKSQASASHSRLCPATELPCRKAPKCESICVQSGEALKESVEGS